MMTMRIVRPTSPRPHKDYRYSEKDPVDKRKEEQAIKAQRVRNYQAMARQGKPIFEKADR